ncbi:MAG: 30S ribosomal protein S18 [Patescibacteria group bacterium]
MSKKVKMSSAGALYFDHKDVKLLQRYINQFGQIESRRKTGLTEMQQRRLSKAIKRARHLALLPFINHG